MNSRYASVKKCEKVVGLVEAFWKEIAFFLGINILSVSTWW